MLAHDTHQVRLVRPRRRHIEVPERRPDGVPRRARHHLIPIKECLRLRSKPAHIACIIIGAHRRAHRNGNRHEGLLSLLRRIKWRARALQELRVFRDADRALRRAVPPMTGPIHW